MCPIKSNPKFINVMKHTETTKIKKSKIHLKT